MEERSLQFIGIMALIGVVGIVAFLIVLVTKHLSKRKSEGGTDEAVTIEPHWLAITLAGLALVLVTVIFLWFLLPGSFDQLLSGAPRGSIFLIVMLVVAVLALLVFIGALITRANRADVQAHPGHAAGTSQAAAQSGADSMPEGAVPVSAGIRIVGLGFIPVALLIFGWSALSSDIQHAFTARLAYPATAIIALVLLFDKATRAWSSKSGAEVFREWLFLDLFIVLALIGFWNIISLADPSAYRSFFWDILGLFGFLVAFWIVDRTRTRFRFLLGYIFLILLPVLLIIWQAMTPPPAPAEAADISWWDTYWPVFYLSIVFGVLEIILLAASRDPSRQALPALKDTLFFVVYLILLLVAVP